MIGVDPSKRRTRAGLNQLPPAKASLTCLAGAKVSLREAAISIVSPGCWIAALLSRAVLDLELAKARARLVATLRSLRDAGEGRLDRLLGLAFLDPGSFRHVVNQL